MKPEREFRRLHRRLRRLVGSLAATEQLGRKGNPAVEAVNGTNGDGDQNSLPHCLVGNARDAMTDAKSAAEDALGESLVALWAIEERRANESARRLNNVAEMLDGLRAPLARLERVARAAREKDGYWPVWARRVALACIDCHESLLEVRRVRRRCAVACSRVQEWVSSSSGDDEDGDADSERGPQPAGKGTALPFRRVSNG